MTLPESAGIVRKELAIKLVSVVSCHCPYRSFDIVLDFLVSAFESILAFLQVCASCHESTYLNIDIY